MRLVVAKFVHGFPDRNHVPSLSRRRPPRAGTPVAGTTPGSAFPAGDHAGGRRTPRLRRAHPRPQRQFAARSPGALRRGAPSRAIERARIPLPRDGHRRFRCSRRPRETAAQRRSGGDGGAAGRSKPDARLDRTGGIVTAGSRHRAHRSHAGPGLRPIAPCRGALPQPRLCHRHRRSGRRLFFAAIVVGARAGFRQD